MDTQTFRSAPIEHDISDTNRSVSDNKFETEGTSNIELPFSQYSAFNQVPYSVDYFKIDNFEHLNDITDIDGIRGKIETIESYIMKQITERQLEDKISTYNDILEEFMNAIGIDKNEMDISKLNKLSKYVKMVGKKGPADVEKDLIKRQEMMKQNWQSKEQSYKEKMDGIAKEKAELARELSKYRALNRQLENEKKSETTKVNDYKQIIEKYINN